MNEKRLQEYLEQIQAPGSVEERKARLRFLTEILQTTARSQGNPQILYPLLEANLEQLDEILAGVLRFWAEVKLREKKEQAIDTAIDIGNFSNLFLDFPVGSRANNLEIAITGYEVIQTVFTHEALPNLWASVQNNLGKAYWQRIRGERKENLELAIQAFQAALQVKTRRALPQEWAMIQNNLGNAYLERIRGERKENLELAIKAFQGALQIRTRKALPQQWAITQNNLGNAYFERIRGDRGGNLELAIQAFQAALQVFTRSTLPQQWSITQNNLGNTYCERILGDREDNLELAIKAFQAALRVRTRSTLPRDWAITKHNLGLVYLERIRGERKENIELAIQAFQAALQIRTRKALPQQWAETQRGLGNAYLERIRGGREENQESAIKAFQAALQVSTRNAFSREWAMIKYNLGNVYLERIRGDREDNLESAIKAFHAALKVSTRNAFPREYISIQYNLGLAYTAYDNPRNFQMAYSTLKEAIETLNSLREEILSGDETKRKLAEKYNRMYQRIVEVCLELDHVTEAVEYVERSKTRNLVELILDRDRKTIFPPEVVTQLEKLRDEIAVGQYQIQNGEAENPQVLGQHLQQLRKQRNELQDRYLPVGSGFNFDSFKATLDKHTAIIEWYILDDKILAFIIKSTGKITVWQSQLKDREALGNWVDQYLSNYYNQEEQWHNSLEEELKKLASILHIDEILAQIPKDCNCLILIPHQLLHLFPLHALPVTNQDSQTSPYFLDLFAGGVSYAPSCQLLQQLQRREHSDIRSLFAIQNPTEDLEYTDLEVGAISSLFADKEVLSKNQATQTALYQALSQIKQANYLHFSCHGTFNLEIPQNSSLLLAGAVENDELDLSKCLTLGNLFERDFNLNQCRLVVLSACETGLIDFNNTSDEYIGLPSGFLYAGSSSVVSSLWTVSDLSTAFLMIKFIQNLKATTVDGGDFSVAVELQKAQLWLRNATTAQLQAWANDLKLSPEQARKKYDTLNWFDDDEKPFQNPVYWAAFCVIGL